MFEYQYTDIYENREERKTPVPTPHIIDKISDQMFSDFESNQSLNEDNISSGKKSKYDQPSISRRSKADRQKIRNVRKHEKERNICDDAKLANNQSSLSSATAPVFNEKVQSKDFSKTMAPASNKQPKAKEDKVSTCVDSKNQSMKAKTDSLSGMVFVLILLGTTNKNQLNRKMQNKNIRYDKSKAAKAEKNRK